jgi:hypothetical protein|tara:strand:- start:305 stop:664 length:360 start_codon:yes stop_codon:yes gene_type:complete
MNIKSKISLLLDCKPIINKEDNTIFFYPHDKKDKKIINESNFENVWTWLIPEGQDVIGTGRWCVDRNAYVITEKSWATLFKPTDLFKPTGKPKIKSLFFKFLPRDFKTIENYVKEEKNA